MYCLNLLTKDLLRSHNETKQNFLAVIVQFIARYRLIYLDLRLFWKQNDHVELHSKEELFSLLRSDSMLPHTADKQSAALKPCALVIGSYKKNI